MASLPCLRYEKKFRDYQRKAIQMSRRYRASFEKGETKGAALVCHPTGTGKTAIIAGLAQASPEIKTTLVLTTRKAIRDQLVRELTANLFLNSDKFGLSSGILLRKVVLVINERVALKQPIGKVYEKTLALLSDKDKEQRFYATDRFSKIINDSEQTVIKALETGHIIIVMTVQMLGHIKKNEKSQYTSLKKNLALTLFDEGHYEPAVKYSNSVRNLDCPYVLFSATPFRNDLKPFELEKRNIDIYKYRKAIEKNYVRSITVVRRKHASNAADFCDDIIDFCTVTYGNDRDKWPRVIIHCNERNRITQLGDLFYNKGLSVVGIHDRYRGKDYTTIRDWHHHSVPDPQTTDAKIWIHQYKLLEGIDDHRFKVVAFYDHMKNVRSVVQQVGRVIRRDPREDKAEEAHLLDHYRGRIGQDWELFLKYDESLEEESLLPNFYLKVITSVQPKVDYFDRKFRNLLEIENLKYPASEIMFKRNVTFRKIGKEISVDSIKKKIEEDFESNDIHFQSYDFCPADGNQLDAVLFLYVSIKSPDFLLGSYFAEVRHGAKLVILLKSEEMIAMVDTSGSCNAGLSGFDPISPDKLGRLLSPGARGRVGHISSQNTNLGNRVIRRRTVSAPSLADVPPVLDEHGHVISTIIGYDGVSESVTDDYAIYQCDAGSDCSDKNIYKTEFKVLYESITVDSDKKLLRRYIGMANSHVSEDGEPLRLLAYNRWVLSLVAQMKNAKPLDRIFDRFAPTETHQITKYYTPKSLLIDLYGIEVSYYLNDTGVDLQFDELCLERQRTTTRGDAVFSVTLNGLQHDIVVSFDIVRQRYTLESSSIDDRYVSKDTSDSRPLMRVINVKQAFSIIPENSGLIYVYGRFYAPGLKFGDRFSPDGFYVGRCLYPSLVFEEARSEKGEYVCDIPGIQSDSNEGKFYAPGSLFNIIDSWRDGVKSDTFSIPLEWQSEYQTPPIDFEPNIVICDDTGNNESADFILADENTRCVILVHAKASREWKPYSASAVQEVCAQAQKNTSLFAMFSLQEPPNLTLWGDSHRFNGLTVKSRIRKPLSVENSEDIWKRLKVLLLNPLTDREVWIVLGNMLSAKKFQKGLEENDPPPEALQLNHLLQTTVAALAQVGAKTRIFCAR